MITLKIAILIILVLGYIYAHHKTPKSAQPEYAEAGAFWTVVSVGLIALAGATLVWIWLPDIALFTFQFVLFVYIAALLFILIMGIRKAMDEDEDRYAVMGTGLALVLMMVLIALIVWTIGGLI